MKKCLAVVFILIATQLFAWYDTPLTMKQYTGHKNTGKYKGTKSEVSSVPADWWYVYWTGIGNLTDWTITNTLQGGEFARPPTDAIGKYDATEAQLIRAMSWHSTATVGKTGEYPAGAQQYYVYAAGLWVGALKRFQGDTTWRRVVSKGAYASDMGAMYLPELENAGEAGNVGGRGMAFSTQIIPSNLTHGGSLLFKQPGMIQESYQAIWPFADTMINKRRQDVGTYLNTAEGDIVSQEDSYAVSGDWIPEEDARCIWVRDAGAYDVWGMGIRVEQRTYSWNYAYNESYIYLNWKIRNMTSDTLKEVYVGYFMDNDIGRGSGDPTQGSEDDMIGYDTSWVNVDTVNRKLDLTYTYDIDGKEPGWSTPAGYVGCVICETPENKGLTGVQYWIREGEPGITVDQDMQDSIKYMVLSCTYPSRPAFMVPSVPSDMRQLSCSGPIHILLPGQEVEFTVAIMAGYTLDEIKAKAVNAIRQFNMGYIGFAPPPSPSLSVIPGDKKVYLSWSAFPESYIDGMAKIPTFEGYKVYRSLTGIGNDWTELANFDLRSNGKDTVLVGYTRGASKAKITFEGLVRDTVRVWPTATDTTHYTVLFDTLYKARRYRITFPNQYTFSLMDVDSEISYVYNSEARKLGGNNYCIMDSMSDTLVKPGYSTDPGYVSGSYIYFNGLYIKIKNGTAPDEPGANLHPVPGDEFTIWTYKSDPIGEEVGVQHSYIDAGLQNGVKYYYSVTSYNKPMPEIGLEGLESAKTGKGYWAIPMKTPANYEGAQYALTRTDGLGDGTVRVKVANPESVTGHTYYISFLGEAGAADTMTAKFWRLTDVTNNVVVLDSCKYFQLDSVPVINGLDIKVAKRLVDESLSGKDSLKVDWTRTGWADTTNCGAYKLKAKRSTWIFTPKFNFSSPALSTNEPYYDYKIIMSKQGSRDKNGKYAPFKIKNLDSPNDSVVFLYTDKTPLDTSSLNHSDMISIYKTPTIWSVALTVDTTRITSGFYMRPDTGDVYELSVLNRLTTRDVFRVTTVAFNKTKSTYNLDNIRVVPNPYLIRASWDRNKYQHKIWFQGLPSKCKIKIFTVSGLLVDTIIHDESTFKAMADRSEFAGPGAHVWDFCSKSKEGKKSTIVANGLYIFLVTTDDGKQKIGKFAIIK